MKWLTKVILGPQSRLTQCFGSFVKYASYDYGEGGDVEVRAIRGERPTALYKDEHHRGVDLCFAAQPECRW